MKLTPLPSQQALDSYFLECRAKLLDIAAIFDRIDRGAVPLEFANDARHAKLRQALTILQSPETGRAESVQKLFSLQYDEDWQRPAPH